MKKRIYTWLAMLVSFIAIASVSHAQTTTKNYTVNYVPLVPTTTATSIPSMDEDDCMRTTTYYDGLGRTEQVNQYKGSGDASKDIISATIYDTYGRAYKQYLPFASAQSGAYHTSPTTVSNYTSPYGSTDDDYAFAETTYEASPLGRAQKVRPEGYAWRSGTNHEVKYLYETNTSSSEVEYFYVDGSGNLAHGTDYVAGRLTKNTVWDENITSPTTSYSRTVEYTDKFGNVVASIAYNGTTAHPTYYVYDDFNLLRFVLPPKAVDDASVTSTELDELCYQYKYDERQRLKEKKLPGAGWEYLIYDKKNRLVLSQDEKLRDISSYKYHYYRYDKFDRVTEQGISTESSSYSTLRNTVKASTNYIPSTRSATVYTYYDNYDYQSSWGGDAVFNTYVTVYSDNTQKQDTVTNLVTGVKTKVLGTSTWLYTVNYYDKYGQLLQQFQKNPDGGYNRVSTAYSFTGMPIKQQVYHKKTSGSTAITTEELYTYDQMNRLVETQHSYNGGGYVTLSEETYDDVSRLALDELNNGYQDINYEYNVRGWLTLINDPYDAASNTKLFAEEIYYNSTGELVNLDDHAQYNGNISGIRWRNNSSTRSGYAFTYDGLNRLTKGDYGYGTTSGNVSDSNNYDLYSVAYDKNGNISSLNRKNSSGGTMENLTYSYAGNQLSSLSGTYEGSTISSSSFAYDDNGNTITDNLRGATIDYFDEIDLPSQYTVGSDYTQYEYDAAGTKWSKTAVISGTTTTEYYGNFIYEDGTIDRVLTSNGYYLPSVSKYHYYLKDHLGNTRMVISYSGSTATVEQTSEYYPFGGLFAENSLDKNTYLYNGKELQNEFFENYDYGARFYDAELGRWHSVDPMADQNSDRSPYHFVSNNPINRIDPDGQDDFEFNDKGELVNRTKNKDSDNVYILGDDGNRVDGQSITFDYGTIESHRSQSGTYQKRNADGTKSNEVTTIDIFKVRGDENGTQLFEFFADNTNVEWSQAKTGIGGDKGLNFLTTGHIEYTEPGMSALINGQLSGGYTIRELNHNHPGGTAVPSGIPGLTGNSGDVSFAKAVTEWYEKAYPNRSSSPAYNIYITGKPYIPYSKDSKKEDYGY